MGRIKSNIDCCCNDWMNVIKTIWARVQGMVTSIHYAGNDYYPDGDGKIDLPTPIVTGFVSLFIGDDYCVLATAEGANATLTDKTTYWTLEVN